MKTKKPCKSMDTNLCAKSWRNIPTTMPPARPCAALRPASHVSTKGGITKTVALTAGALTLASAIAFADPTAPLSRQDGYVQSVTPVLRGTMPTPSAEPTSYPATQATAIAAPATTHLAPADPINSSISLVSVEEDIRDIRSPRHVRNPLLWASYAAGALALIVGTFGVWLWYRRGRFLEKLPYEVALDRLEEARRYLNPGHAREFCVAVSEVIRGYIEQRFNMRAAHRTTGEFLRDLLETKDDKLVAHRASLAGFLQHCDMAKFALWRFSVSEMEAMDLSARTFVLQSAIDTTPAVDATQSAPRPKSPQVHLDPPAHVHGTPRPA